MKAAAALLFGALSFVACGPGDRPEGGPDDENGDGDPDDPMPEPRKCNKMDIVFVVDDSGSMEEEQSNLGLNFPQFADVLLNYVNDKGEHIDFRVAVTTTGRDLTYTVAFGGGMGFPTTEQGDDGAFKNNCGSASRWLEPTEPNLGSVLGCRANVGTEGPAYEMPLLMTKWALQDRMADGTNAGFIRPDALLGVVMLTDEDDQSTTANNFTVSASMPDPPPDYHPIDMVNFLDAYKGHRTRWAAGVIAGETACNSSFGDAAEASRLKQFVQAANSTGAQQAVFSSICSGSLTTALQDVLAKFQNACGQIIL